MKHYIYGPEDLVKENEQLKIDIGILAEELSRVNKENLALKSRRFEELFEAWLKLAHEKYDN